MYDIPTQVEELSLTSFINYFVILCLAAIWCILPNDGIAFVTHWFYNKIIMVSLLSAGQWVIA